MLAADNQVGSFHPQRENFRLTPEGKAKFTEKLRFDPREFCGQKGLEKLSAAAKRWIFE